MSPDGAVIRWRRRGIVPCDAATGSSRGGQTAAAGADAGKWQSLGTRLPRVRPPRQLSPQREAARAAALRPGARQRRSRRPGLSPPASPPARGRWRRGR